MVRYIDVCFADGHIVHRFSVSGDLVLEQRRHERNGFQCERVWMLGAARLYFFHKGEKNVVEASVWRYVDYGRGRGKKRLRHDMLQVFAADSYIGFAPSGLRVGAVTVPFSWMEDYHRSSLEMYVFAALELDNPFAFAYVKELIFPVGEGSAVLPGEIVVG